MNENNETPNVTSGKTAATLTVIGLIFVMLAFMILYRAERTNNRQWIAKQARVINPAESGTDSRMVRFTGVPSGDFVADPSTGRKFVYLRRSLYEYEKKGDSAAGPDWHYKEGSTEKAKELGIGAVRVRLDEAEIIGQNIWSTTIFSNDKRADRDPKPGDRKVHVSGIPADHPLFFVGHLSGGYLGAGKLFVVSSYSEGRTLDELSETFVWRWMRNPFCFFLFLTGFILLGHPAMRILKLNADLPVIQSLSRIGWPAYLAVSFVAAYFLVRFSPVTADLLWAFIALIIGVPIYVFVKKSRAA